MTKPYLFFTDIETTGFSPRKHDIIEIACLMVKECDNEYKVLSSFHETCCPYSKKNWTFGAEQMHGITFSEASTYQHPRKMLIKLLHFLNKYRSESSFTFICHAKNHFDFNFLNEAFFKEQLQDSFKKVFNKDDYESTHDIASKYKSAFGVPDLKLSTLADYFDVDLDHHKALSDVECCLEIYKKLKKLGYQLELKI